MKGRPYSGPHKAFIIYTEHFIGNQINGFVTVIFDRIASGF